MERDHLSITESSILNSYQVDTIKKPRILIVDNSIALTGALETALRASAALSTKFDFLFLLPSGNRISDRVARAGFLSQEIPMKEIRKDLLSILFYFPMLLINVVRIAGIIKKERIDLIHSNDLYNMLPVMYRIFGGKVPYICHVRFMPDRFPRVLTKIWFGLHRRYAHAIVVVSQAVKSLLPQNIKVELIGDCLPVEDDGFVSESEKILLFPANFTKGKGHDYAIHAFATIATKFAHWKLRFIGGDLGLEKNRSYKREMKALATKSGISNQVEWLDFSDDMKTQYQRCAIVINFSESESFSLTCLEASFYGRPVIATASGGPGEIIADNASGIMTPRGDLSAMTVAMVRLMNDAELRLRMGRQGRELVRSRFGSEKTSARLGNLYAGVIPC